MKNYKATTLSSFRPETLPQPYSIPDVSPYSKKLEELQLLLGKFSSAHNAYIILELAKFNLRQGDEGFLNDRLEQFRALDGQG
jgi:hypothetical protein